RARSRHDDDCATELSRALSREVQQDCGAATDFAFGFDAPAVSLHEVLHDRESQSRATLLTRPSGIHAVESLEDAGQVIGGNAAARITHTDEQVGAGTLGQHAYSATRRRMA